MNQPTVPGSHHRLVWRLVLACSLMFGFGFALVPLYDVFCQVTGLNGKINGPSTVEGQQIDRQREVRVRFLGINNEGMPWRFAPEEAVLSVHPGEMRQTAFVAANPTPHAMVAQAIPSVSPGEAARYLHKVNCFCFNSQQLAAGEQVQMPLLFVIDRQLPAHIHSITLSYTLFDISPERRTPPLLSGAKTESVPGLVKHDTGGDASLPRAQRDVGYIDTAISGDTEHPGHRPEGQADVEREGAI